MPTPATITAALDRALESHVFSGYQLYAERQDRKIEVSGGILSYWGEPVAVTPATRFDIGSVTKAVVTTSLFAVAVQEKLVALSDRVSRYLPELAATDLEDRTLADLLTHSSGLVGWYPVYEEADRGSLLAWFKKSAGSLVEEPAGVRAVYSDLGFMLLGLVLETIFGPLEAAFRSRVAERTGITETVYGPVPGWEAAATEYCLLRRRVLQGEIFDENCHFLGGRLGHAGLFATTRGLAPWCREWLKALEGKSPWLSLETARRVTTKSDRVPGSSWAYGWDTKSPKGSSAGELFSPKSFGHLGYPGCSVWIDPVQGGFVLFFTNRIHPSRYDERIRALRPRLHDAVAQVWAEGG